jgi:Fe-S cluster assembly protein SufB
MSNVKPGKIPEPQEFYGFREPVNYLDLRFKGLREEVVREISQVREEPEWMLQIRLRAFRHFIERPIPTWGPDLSGIHFDDFYYYAAPSNKKEPAKTWAETPAIGQRTFARLGIPEMEQKFLAGMGAIVESQEIYNRLQKDLKDQGVIFTTVGNAVKNHPDLIKKWFGRIIPFNDNKFAALNTAFWSDGPFIYVPPGVKIAKPLESYFRINAKNVAQFERTLLIADTGAEVSYLEGCSASQYDSAMLHAAVVEIVALKDATVRYHTMQNWNKDVYNLVTKRAHAYENAKVSWVNLESGSRLNMKYPSTYLLGRGAKTEIYSLAYAGAGQLQDTGGKAIHLASDTSSKIISKSISKDGGRTVYRGLIHVDPRAHNVKSAVRCDALLIDADSQTATFPYEEIEADDASCSHEASVNKISDESLFYLESRGINENDAISMVVNGFAEEITKELPPVQAVEINRILQLEMAGSVG